MEHRHGARVKVGLPVLVSVRDRKLGWFTSRDVGNGGISLNGLDGLARNTVVSLSIEVMQNGRVVTQTARAVVIHQKQGRIGLMWASQGISLQKLVPAFREQVAA